jgi:hypothetical protein
MTGKIRPGYSDNIVTSRDSRQTVYAAWWQESSPFPCSREGSSFDSLEDSANTQPGAPLEAATLSLSLVTSAATKE